MRIDNNLNYYINRLRYKNDHIKGKDRSKLTREYLIELWHSQSGLCAMSGSPMTYRAAKGVYFPLNASIDCIIPIKQGGRYEPGNVQLVCSLLNSLMKHASKDEIVALCLGVARAAEANGQTRAAAPHPN